MAAYVNTNALVVVGSFDASASTVKVETTPATCAVVDVTTVASGGFVCLAAGLKSYGLNLDVFADHTATGITTAFTPQAALGTQYAVTVCPQTGGATVGDPAIFTRGILNSYTPWGGQIGAAAASNMQFTSDTAEINGQVAAPLAARTVTANGSQVNMTGPTATQKVWAAIHVTALSGSASPTLTPKIQSNTLTAFAGTTTDRITFTAMTATGWQFASTSGAITDAFWRLQWTISGTTPSFTFLAVVGVL